MISRLNIQEIPGNDCKYLRLVDNSYYNPDIAISNEILEITPPGFDCPVIFNVDHHFNTAFNSSLLKTSPTNPNVILTELPDGLYHIKYSINPNLVLYVEHNHFRTCKLQSKYAVSICDLFSKRCELSHKNFEEKRKELIWIKELIDASKYLVEECCDIKSGIELYNEASELLQNINKCYCGK